MVDAISNVNAAADENEELRQTAAIRDMLINKTVARIAVERPDPEEVDRLTRLLDSRDKNTGMRARIKTDADASKDNKEWQNIARELARIPTKDLPGAQPRADNKDSFKLPELPDGIDFTLAPGEFDDANKGGSENSSQFIARMNKSEK